MKERIIIALDVDDLAEAKNLVDKLEEAVYFKIGLRPFLKFGDEMIDYLHQKGFRFPRKINSAPNSLVLPSRDKVCVLSILLSRVFRVLVSQISHSVPSDLAWVC